MPGNTGEEADAARTPESEGNTEAEADAVREPESEGNWIWNNVIERGLGAFASAMRIGGGVARITPRFFRAPIHWTIIRVSELLNQRRLLDPIEYGMGTVGLKLIKGSDRSQDYKALELFFRLGLEVGNDPPFGKRHAYGYGDDNCFFPNQLAAGPRILPRTEPPMTNKDNVRIAETCALLSILSYRDDEEIKHCMEMTPMLPNVSFLSVHTPQEGDLAIYIDKDEKWVVFCFRGTEYETLRDWFTSALLNPMTHFPGDCLIREDEMVPVMDEVRVRDRYYKQMLLACRDSRVTPQHTTADAAVIPRSATTSAFTLVEYLCRRGSKTQIYFTGHSLGGGLATLMGASCEALSLHPSAIVTFGSPPVGDGGFCRWYNESLSFRSWRFVNADEFAPMAPPLPFTEPVQDQQLVHVQKLIKVQDLTETAGGARRRQPRSMDMRLRTLQRRNNLSKILLDHNPALTLLALRDLDRDHYNPRPGPYGGVREERNLLRP